MKNGWSLFQTWLRVGSFQLKTPLGWSICTEDGYWRSLDSFFFFIFSSPPSQARPLQSGRLLWCLAQCLQGFCGPLVALHLSVARQTPERTVNWRNWGPVLLEDCGRLGKKDDCKVGCPLSLGAGGSSRLHLVCYSCPFSAPSVHLGHPSALKSWSECLNRPWPWARQHPFACPCHPQSWILATSPPVDPRGWFWPGVLETSAWLGEESEEGGDPLCRPLGAGSLSEQLDVVFASSGASSDPGLR